MGGGAYISSEFSGNLKLTKDLLAKMLRRKIGGRDGVEIV